MARLLVLCALIGAALAGPTPQTLPKSVLGVYENVPSESKNFEQFVTVFGLPKHTKFDRNNLLGFWKEGDTYHTRFAYWPLENTFDLPFKLGETQKTTIMGKEMEYVYTLETGETPETPVLRGKFRMVDGDLKFTIEEAFSKNAVNITYTRDNIVATRNYKRTLPPYVMGAYESDPTRVAPESIEFFNSIYPLPGGLKWRKDTRFFMGVEHGKFYEKIIVDRTFGYYWTFQFDEPLVFQHGGENISSTYTLVDTNAANTTIRAECTSSHGKVIYTDVFDHKGVSVTIKTDKKEFTAYYKRVVPWMFYGTFEVVPEKTENWEQFMDGDKGCKIADATTAFRIWRKSDDEYAVTKVLNGTKKVTIPFKLDTPGEGTLPNGKTIKFNTTLFIGNETLMITRSRIGDKKFVVEEKLKPCGLVLTYRRGDVEGVKYFRRVIAKPVFGTFESPEFTSDEEFKKHVTTHGMEDLLKKTTVELSETPDHKLKKVMTIEGEEPKEIIVKLGEAVNVTCPKTGKTYKIKVLYFESENKPTLVALYQNAAGKNLLRVTKVFTPEGCTSTIVYGNMANGGDKIAKRTWTRKGAAVPYEMPESA